MATSEGCPTRPTIVLDAIRSKRASVSGVADPGNGPSVIELTRMPSGASSAAAYRVSWSIAALAAPYAGGLRPSSES